MPLINLLRKLFGSSSHFPYDVAGNFSDIEANVSRVLVNQQNTGVLVIQVVDHEAFVQFTGGQSGIQLAFPMVTEYQKSSEPSLRSFLKGHGMDVHESSGSDGTRFLDVDLPPDSKTIATTISQLLVSLYGISSEAKLRFMGERLGVAA